jgi:hypothetical protein
LIYFRTVNALVFAMIKENGPVVCLALLEKIRKGA